MHPGHRNGALRGPHLRTHEKKHPQLGAQEESDRCGYCEIGGEVGMEWMEYG